MIRRVLFIEAGAADMAQKLVRILQGPDVVVSQVENQPTVCRAEGPRIDRMSVEEATAELERLIADATALLHIYQPSVAVNLRSRGHAEIRPNGSKRAYSPRFTIKLVDGTGIDSLAIKEASGSTRGWQILQAAINDDDIKRALGLLNSPEPSWAQLYDVIKFLEDADAIAARGWASRSEVIRHRQTANHFRHQGDLHRYPLPANQPSLVESQTFVLGLLRRWLEDRVAARGGS